MAQSQVNIRMDSRQLEVLEAAAFVDGRSVPDLIRAALDDLAKELGEQAPVQLALQARDERMRQSRGNVRGFPTKHRAQRAADG